MTSLVVISGDLRFRGTLATAPSDVAANRVCPGYWIKPCARPQSMPAHEVLLRDAERVGRDEPRWRV